MNVTTFVIGYLIGVVAEAIFATIWDCIRSARGTLVIDKTDPEKDLYRLDLDDLDAIEKKKRVDLKVSIVEVPSQK
jgi:hypothetical protein